MKKIPNLDSHVNEYVTFTVNNLLNLILNSVKNNELNKKNAVEAFEYDLTCATKDMKNVLSYLVNHYVDEHKEEWINKLKSQIDSLN